jgi:hypothetical protein
MKSIVKEITTKLTRMKNMKNNEICPQSTTISYLYCFFKMRYCIFMCFEKITELQVEKQMLHECGAGPRHVGALGWLIICCHLRPIFFKLLQPTTELETLTKHVCPTCR